MTPLEIDRNISVFRRWISELNKRLVDSEKRIEKLEKTVRDILRTANCLQPED